MSNKNAETNGTKATAQAEGKATFNETRVVSCMEAIKAVEQQHRGAWGQLAPIFKGVTFAEFKMDRKEVSARCKKDDAVDYKSNTINGMFTFIARILENGHDLPDTLIEARALYAKCPKANRGARTHAAKGEEAETVESAATGREVPVVDNPLAGFDSKLVREAHAAIDAGASQDAILAAIAVADLLGNELVQEALQLAREEKLSELVAGDEIDEGDEGTDEGGSVKLAA